MRDGRNEVVVTVVNGGAGAGRLEKGGGTEGTNAPSAPIQARLGEGGFAGLRRGLSRAAA